MIGTVAADGRRATNEVVTFAVIAAQLGPPVVGSHARRCARLSLAYHSPDMKLFYSIAPVASLVLGLVVALHSAGCGSSQKLGAGNEVMAPTDGGSVMVPSGDVLRVDLTSNPTTGYRWQVDQLPAGLAVEGESIFVRDPNGGPAGGGGIEQWRFAAAGGPTEGTLRMSYRRPWERDQPPARTYVVEVRIVGN